MGIFLMTRGNGMTAHIHRRIGLKPSSDRYVIILWVVHINMFRVLICVGWACVYIQMNTHTLCKYRYLCIYKKGVI